MIRARRLLLVLVALVLAGLGLLAACAPDAASASAARPVGLRTETVFVAAGTFKVRAFWRYQNDGNGTPDSVIVSLYVAPGTAAAQVHRLPATATADSFTVASAGIAVPMSGTVRLVTKRRGRLSTEVSAPWSYTEPDVDPPPPVFDSLRVSYLETVPGSVAMLTGTSKTFCAVLVFASGQRAIIGGQRGVAECEAVEAGLPIEQTATSAQYAVAAEYASCSVEADGVARCRFADGSVRLAVRSTFGGGGPRSGLVAVAS